MTLIEMDRTRILNWVLSYTSPSLKERLVPFYKEIQEIPSYCITD